MEFWQQAVLLAFSVINILISGKGLYECKVEKHAYVLVPKLYVLGIFAWGDAVVFGLFWAASALVSYLLKDWYLFLLIVSVFWLVRSLGETIYWFNQQFSNINRNPPEKLPLFSIFQNDSIWYIHQIGWQCVTIVSIIFTIYFSKLWLQNKF